MSSTVPAEFKSIKKFIREAERIEKFKPTIAHFCRLYAIQEALKTEASTEWNSGKQWLTQQLFLCEANTTLQTHTALQTQKGWDEAKIEITNVADMIFKHADQTLNMLVNEADKKTAAAFYSAHVLYETLQLKAFGVRSDEIIERSKYALSKTTHILKAIKQRKNTKPEPVHSNSDDIKQNETESKLCYNQDVIAQLVNLQFATQQQCIQASKRCVDFNNFSEVIDQLNRIKQQNAAVATNNQQTDHKNNDNVLTKDCPGNHGLENFGIFSCGLSCDVCSAKFSNMTMFTCASCDFIVCSQCHIGKEQVKMQNNDDDDDDSGSDYSEICAYYHTVFQIDIPQKYLYPYENSKRLEELLFSGFIRQLRSLDLFANDIISIISIYCKGVVNIIRESDPMNIISGNDIQQANELKMQADINYELIFLQKQKVDEAIDIYTKAMHYNPNDYYLFLMRSKCYLKLKQYEKALKDILNALEIEPSSVNSWNIYGLINGNLNDFESAGVGFAIAETMTRHDQNRRKYKFDKSEETFSLMFDQMRKTTRTAADQMAYCCIADIVSGERFFAVASRREQILNDLAENDETIKHLSERLNETMKTNDTNDMFEFSEYVEIFAEFLKHDECKLYLKDMQFYKLIQEAYYNDIEILARRDDDKTCQDDCFWFVTCTSLSKIKYNKRLFGILVMATYDGANSFDDVIAKHTLYGEPTADQLIQILKRTISCNISNEKLNGEFRFFIPRGIILGDNICDKQPQIEKYFDDKRYEYPIEMILSIRALFEQDSMWQIFEKGRQIQFPTWKFVGCNNLNMFQWNLIH